MELSKYISRFLLLTFFSISALAAEIPLKDLIPRYTDATSSFIKIDGLKFHVREEGKGPTIVLLHGILASLHTWDGWVPTLAKKYRVVRIDLPAHGLTGPDPKGEYSIERMTKLIEKLYNKLEIKEAHLIGNSLGGWIAWEFAVRNSERVTKLVLIDPAGFNTDEVPWVVSFAKLPLAPYLLTGNAPRFAVRYMVESVYGNPDLITEDTVTRYRELFLREGNGKAFFDLVRAPVENNSAALKKLKMPVFIMWGEKDGWISPEYARSFHSSIPQSKLLTFPLLGHIPMEESPKETLKPTLQFLK